MAVCTGEKGVGGALMRVLHFLPVWAPAWQFGGPVRSVGRLCEALAFEGVDVEVITTTAGLPDWPLESTGRPIRQGGVTVTYYPVDSPVGPIRSRALLKALPAHLSRTELLHLSAIWQPLGPPVQRAALGQRVPVIHSLRGALSSYSLGWKAWKKLPYHWLVEHPLLRRAAVLHGTSLSELSDLDNPLLGLQGEPPKRWLLPNPLDEACFVVNPAAAKALRDRLQVKSEERLLLVCGRHHHKKGLDLLVPVLSSLASYPWRLLLVGPDEDGSGSFLERQLSRIVGSERLLRLPLQPGSELPALFCAADLLLMPSRHENFGNVAVEALACGCPVLLSEAVGAAADIKDVMNSQPWGTALPRRVELWREWLEDWVPGSPHAS